MKMDDFRQSLRETTEFTHRGGYFRGAKIGPSDRGAYMPGSCLVRATHFSKKCLKSHFPFILGFFRHSIFQLENLLKEGAS